MLAPCVRCVSTSVSSRSGYYRAHEAEQPSEALPTVGTAAPVAEETIDRVPLPTALVGHKRLRGHFVQGPRPPTVQERIESDAVGRYSALVPSGTGAAAEDATVPFSHPQPPVHQCLSLVDHEALPAWLAQCVDDQEWEDPFVAEDLPEYLTCCFERDFGVILDEVTLTDEVDLIQACEHWGQRVDKQLRAEWPKVDHERGSHDRPQNLLRLHLGLALSIPPPPCLMSGKIQ